MLIAELLENDAIEPEMILRNISRKMRSGKLVFPAVFAYLTQETPASIPFIFPVIGLEQKYNIPIEFYDNIKFSAMIYHGNDIHVNYAMWCEVKRKHDTTDEQIKDALHIFLPNYFSKIIGRLNGVPSFDEFRYYNNYVRLNIEWQGDNLERRVSTWLRAHEEMICLLARHLLINDFANLVKTIQHVE